MTLTGLPLLRSGKVRDIYEVDDGLLLVASDRISAFDVVLPTLIPGKGQVLTGLSAFWFGRTDHIVPNHVLATDPDDFPAEAKEHRDALRGRAMLVRRTDVVPIECVARGYISGSGWKEYRASGTVCGIELPAGLREFERLPEPIFTPSTKAETGHDENISFDAACDVAGRAVMEKLRDYTLRLYAEGAAHAETCGIILADTKFEFGLLDGEIILIDEVLTPDSSRFWPADAYVPGSPVPSFDKQFVRDWLDASGWDHEPPGPQLPDDVVNATRAKYVEAYERISGLSFDRWLS